MGILTKEQKIMRQERARLDLSLQIQKLMAGFESKEEPGYEYSEQDKINVLSKIINNKTSIGRNIEIE